MSIIIKNQEFRHWSYCRNSQFLLLPKSLTIAKIDI